MNTFRSILFVVLASLAANAQAEHTLTIQSGESVTIYEGELLSIDAAGSRAIVQFRGDSATWHKRAPTATLRNAKLTQAGDVDVLVEGIAPFVAEHCRSVYFAYMAGNSHLSLACDGPAHASIVGAGR